jgi:hypothetical protein
MRPILLWHSCQAAMSTCSRSSFSLNSTNWSLGRTPLTTHLFTCPSRQFLNTEKEHPHLLAVAKQNGCFRASRKRSFTFREYGGGHRGSIQPHFYVLKPEEGGKSSLCLYTNESAYSLDLECPPKAHVLNVWFSSLWHYWKVVEYFRR